MTLPLLLALLVLATPGDPPPSLWQRDGAGLPPGLGTVLAPSPDRDGDGVADLLVGLPGLATGPEAGAGEVLVLSGADGSVLLRATGRRRGEAFGAALASLPDLDSDGTPDLAVGAPRADELAVNAGAVTVLSGRDGRTLFRIAGRGAEPQPLRRVGEEPFGLLGSALAACDDVDGDGTPDLFVGAPSDPHAGTDPGRVLVLSGADGSVLVRHLGDQRGERFGQALATLPDRDGDGAPELLVAAPLATRGGRVHGRVQVRSGRGGEVLLEALGEPGDRLGTSLAVLPDLDGDGLPELAAGAPGAGTRQLVAAGAVRILSGATGQVLRSLEGERSHERLGAALVLAGDTDGDGLAELALGSSRAAAGAGRVRLHALADGAPLRSVEGWTPTQGLGLSLAPLGDVDGDGRDDLVAGWLHGPRPGPTPGGLTALPGTPPPPEPEPRRKRRQ